MDLLFSITALELFVGGGGRLMPIGPATVRMVLFAACLCTWLLVSLVSRRQRADGQLLALGLVAGYFTAHLPGVFSAIFNGIGMAEAMGEMQQSLYWMAAPFFAMALQRMEMVERAAKLVQAAGVILSAAYMLAIGALFLGLLNFTMLYHLAMETNEFYFRGESFFFYKGFIYLGLAIIFLVALRGRRWLPLAIFVGLGLILTLTRGFVLSTSIALLCLLMAQRRWATVGTALLVIVAVAMAVWVYLPAADDSIMDQRGTSTSQRIEDMLFIANNISVGTLFFGEGFGSYINNRASIENTYLWALWKLGGLGLMFWFVPLLICLNFFLRIRRSDSHYKMACAYFFGTILIYIQTATNPYLNNPIGLSFVMIALFSLRTISRKEKSNFTSADARAPGTLPRKSRHKKILAPRAV